MRQVLEKKVGEYPCIYSLSVEQKFVFLLKSQNAYINNIVASSVYTSFRTHNL